MTPDPSLARLRERLECGHPRACLEGIFQVCADIQCNEDHEMLHQHVVGERCTVCAEIALAVAEARHEEAKWWAERYWPFYREDSDFAQDGSEASQRMASVKQHLAELKAGTGGVIGKR